jgi:hypothetical protein
MPEPGSELFRSDRRFRPWRYGVSHTEFLLRSWTPRSGPDKTIDIQFIGTRRMLIRDGYRGLVIRLASEEHAAAIKAETPQLYGRFSGAYSVFLLESQNEIDYVVAATVVWGEGVLTAGQRDVLTAE